MEEQAQGRVGTGCPLPRRLSPEVVRAHLASFLEVAQDVPHEYWSAEHFLADRPGKWDFSLAAFDRDDPAGVLGYAIASRPGPEVVHLHHLMVRRELRGGGVGKRLLDELIHRAGLAGAQSIRLKVHAGNAGALRFYQREGFTPAGAEGEYPVLLGPARARRRRVAIHQPNYLPWCGYLAKVRAVDVFVFLDDAQMPGGQSYVYRTQVAGNKGPQWLSVPTQRTLDQPIRTVRFADDRWPRKHLTTLRTQYGRRPFFKEVFAWLEPIYLAAGERLAPFNERLIRAACAYLGLDVQFVRSSELAVAGTSDDRLIELVQAVGGTTYLSGKGGQNYQDPKKFADAGIELEVRGYQPVPYDQGGPAFEPGLSAFDALVNVGRGAGELLGYGEARAAAPAA